jgi:hypothetical protein
MRKVTGLVIVVLAWTGTAIAQNDVKERTELRAPRRLNSA